jgi:hypothetical protein
VRLCCVFLLSLAICPFSVACAQEDRLVVREDPSDTSRFICDIKFATFTTPIGWRPNRSGGKTYAVLTLSSENYPELSQKIMIDIGKSIEPTAKGLAKAFAKEWKGEVSSESVDLDGEQGYRVTIPADPKTLSPTDCIVVVKDMRGFLLMGGATDTKAASKLPKVMDELVASWKWK